MLKEIVERRSCRKFDTSKQVKEEDLEKVIEAGLLAPSGMNRQESVIIAITNKEVRDCYAKNAGEVSGRGGDPFYGAPVIIFVGCKKFPLAKNDGSTIIENMLLEATHLGLSSCWIHGAKEYLESEEGRRILSSSGANLEDYEGIGHVALGYNGGYTPNPKVIKEGRKFYIK